MPPNFPGLTNDLNLFTSENVEIIAESGQKTFTVHKNILTAHSEPLREAAGKKINLSDWDGDTVARFIQFLYVGDYQVPESFTDEDDIEESEEGEERRDGVYTPDTIQSLADREQLRTKEADVLLVHAKLYTLAQDKGVGALGKMALERLKMVLSGINVLMWTPKVAVDVIRLLEYVYSRKCTKNVMRDFVSGFAAENIEKLMGRRGMVVLLRKGGELAAELMEKVSGRVCDMERGMEDLKGQVAASDEKVHQSEVSSAEKLQQLEAKILEFENKAKLEEATNMAKERELEAAKVQELEAKVGSLEAKLKGLETSVVKVQDFEPGLRTIYKDFGLVYPV